MSERRVVLAAGSALVLAAMSLASAALACSGQARLFGISPSAAAPGALIKVNGGAVTPAIPIQIRWNTLDGQQIGEAAEPVNDFETIFFRNY